MPDDFAEQMRRTPNRTEVALRIFCAGLSQNDAKLDLYPELGELQIRTAFMLADNFLRVANEDKHP